MESTGNYMSEILFLSFFNLFALKPLLYLFIYLFSFCWVGNDKYLISLGGDLLIVRQCL